MCNTLKGERDSGGGGVRWRSHILSAFNHRSGMFAFNFMEPNEFYSIYTMNLQFRFGNSTGPGKQAPNVNKSIKTLTIGQQRVAVCVLYLL